MFDKLYFVTKSPVTLELNDWKIGRLVCLVRVFSTVLLTHKNPSSRCQLGFFISDTHTNYVCIKKYLFYSDTQARKGKRRKDFLE